MAIYNKDSEIVNLDYFYNKNNNGEEDKEEIDLVINLGRTNESTIW